MHNPTRRELPPVADVAMGVKAMVLGLFSILSGAVMTWIGAAVLLNGNGSDSVSISPPPSTGGLIVTLLLGLGLTTVGVTLVVWEITGKREKVRQREADRPVVATPHAKWIGQVARIALALFMTLVWAGQVNVFRPGARPAIVAVRLLAIFAVAWLVVS